MGAASGAKQQLLIRTLLRVTVVALAYFLGARAGLAVAFENRNITAVWPPTGIAVAALLIWDLGVWPGIAIGALGANLANHAGIQTSAAITVGNTIAPVVAVLALRRLVSFDDRLEHPRDVLALFGIGGFGAMTISATLGTLALLITGATTKTHLGSDWLVWWIGDAIGVVLFTPFLVLASRVTSRSPIVKRRRETLIVLAVSIAIALLVFNTDIPLGYLLLIPVVWSGRWFEQTGATLITVLLASIAVAETVNGHGPFSTLSPTGNLISLQVFNATLAFAGLIVAGMVRARRRAEDALRTSELRHRRLFEQASDAVWVHDLDGRISYANPAASALTDIPLNRLQSITMEELAGPEQALIVKRAITRLVESQDATSYQLEINRVTLEVSAVIVDNAVQVIARDVTSRAIEEGHLRRKALRDPGTGLPNRTLLAERIEYALAMTERTGGAVALYDLDLDDFARLNEEKGQGAGDVLLRTIAHRLGSIVGPTDTVARIDGDEFAILVAPFDHPDEAHAYGLRIAEEVRRCGATASIGVSVWDGRTTDIEALIRQAEHAMQAAKRKGSGGIEVYRPEDETINEIHARLKEW